MKRAFAVLICLILALNALSYSVFAVASGDANLDGVVDIIDVASLRASIIGSLVLSPDQILNGDMNGDDVIDIVDVAICRSTIIENAKPISDDEIIPEVATDINGVWFSYIEIARFLEEKNEADFTRTFAQMVETCKSLNINTMFIHVRSHGDAYYKSELFPTSVFLSGTFNKDLDYDALEIMTRVCHEYGVKIHAWINPYRLCTQKEMQTLPDTYKIKQWYNANDGHIFLYNGRYYLNPAADGVTELITDGVREVMKYDIDGVQIDDYFYPETNDDIDNKEFDASGYSSHAQFRLDTCSKMVKSMNEATKEGARKVVFGVSPQGNINNNYELVYADVKLWATSREYVDYIAPQIYFGFNNTPQPFMRCLSEWQELVRNSDVKLLCGIAAYKIGTVDTWAKDGKNEWIDSTAILARQITEIKKADFYNGFIYFDFESLFAPNSDVAAQVAAEIEEIRKIIW